MGGPPTMKIELDPTARRTMENLTKAIEKLTQTQKVSGTFVQNVTTPEYPHRSGDFTVIGPECFTDESLNVISWKGDNFYRACGVRVFDAGGGAGSTCVKRKGHDVTKYHEDYDGRVVEDGQVLT